MARKETSPFSPIQLRSGERQDVQQVISTLRDQLDIEVSRLNSKVNGVASSSAIVATSGQKGDKGDNGATGPTGPGGVATNVVVSALCGENITATDVVYMDSAKRIFRADSSNTAHADAIFGVSTQSVSSGSFANVLLFGPIVDSAFAFPIGTALFLNGVGSLSATPPTSGFSLFMGKQSDATTFFLDKQVPIILT